MAHTKGPWKVGGKFGTMVMDSDGANIVAEVWSVNGVDQGKLDARLIAAAPELLDALKSLALWRDTEGSIMMLAEVVEQARVVIAKAEGRA